MKPNNGKAPGVRPTNGSSGQMTIAEMARLGGRARAERHSKAEIRRWGRQGGRPSKLDRKALARLARLLAAGKSQGECAAELGVSIRTVARAVATMRAGW